MTDDGETGTEMETLSPDEAFATLGNETRLAICQALGEADGPLSFSELHDRVEVRDSGQFNYHLEKLVGHFVEKDEAGYRLRRAGRRVVEAVLSGAVTETPGVDRTRVDESCRYCNAPVEVAWEAGSLLMYCTECPGTYRHSHADGGSRTEEGYLGRMPFPPAGIQGRSPDEILTAAWTWGSLELMAMSAGICPRCSATVAYDLDVCEDHDASDGLCERCDGLHRVRVTVACTNCIFESGGDFVIRLMANGDLLAFLSDHDLNPVSPQSVRPLDRTQGDYEEEVFSRDPFRARFTFTAEDEALVLTVDDDLRVVEALRRDV